MKIAALSTKEGIETLVLGGGIGGLAAAHAHALNGEKVTVLESGAELGGFHGNLDIGGFTFDVGSIFYERGSPIIELSVGTEFQEVNRQQRRIAPDGSLQHYPFDAKEVFQWPKGRLFVAGLSLLWARFLHKPIRNLEDAIMACLGRVFFDDTGLRPYIERFNGVPPNRISARFFEERLGFVAKQSRLRNIAKKLILAVQNKSPRQVNRARLYVRPHAGYRPVFEAIKSNLEGQGVTFELNTSVVSLEKSLDGWSVHTNAGTFSARHVISAIPVENLHQALFGEPTGISALDLMSLFVSAEWLDPKAGNVLYNFHGMGHWKRATIYSRLYERSDTGCEFFTVEQTIKPGEAYNPKAAFSAFKEQVENFGLATGLKLEGSQFSEATYPYYEIDQMQKMATVLERIEAAGITPVGRQGRNEYLPTSTSVFKQVEMVLNRAQ